MCGISWYYIDYDSASLDRVIVNLLPPYHFTGHKNKQTNTPTNKQTHKQTKTKNFHFKVEGVNYYFHTLLFVIDAPGREIFQKRVGGIY